MPVGVSRRRRFRPRPPPTPLVSPVFQTRYWSAASASATTRETTELQRLDKETASFLKFSPLGTLTRQQWDHCTSLMAEWLEMNENNTFVYNAHGLLSADQLLDRLLVEWATQSVAANQRQDVLRPFLLVVLQSWLHLAETTATNQGSSGWVVDRACASWERLIQWQPWLLDKHVGPENGPLSVELVRLVRAVTNTVSSQNDATGIVQAVQLLQQDVVVDLLQQQQNDDDSHNVDLLVACFHETLSLALEQDPATASTLLAHMEKLAAELGMNELAPKEDAMKLALEHFFQNQSDVNSEDTAPVALSDYEANVLQRRLLGLLEDATLEDRDLVHQVVDHWQTSLSPDTLPMLAQAVFDYFVRTQDPKSAGQWLQRASAKLDPTERAARIQQLLQLWANGTDAEAPWRVEELLVDLEHIKQAQPLDAAPYITAAKLWLDSQVSRRGTKALAILNRAPTFGAEILTLRQRATLLESNLEYASVHPLLEQLELNWDAIQPKDLNAAVEDAAKMISVSKLLPEAITFVEFLSFKERLPSTRTCEALAKAVSLESEPDNVVRLLDLLEEKQAPLSFACYESAILALIEIRQKDRIDQVKDLLFRSLHGVSSGTLSADHETVGNLLDAVLEALCYLQRTSDVLEILDEAEKLLVQAPPTEVSPIPLTCYRRAMTLLTAKRMTADLESMFTRLKEHYRNGHADLMPDSNMYTLFILALAKESTNHLDKQQALLDEIVTLYRDSHQNPAYKPQDRQYHSLLTCLKRYPSPDAAPRAVALLDQAVTLGVDFYDAYGFNTAMHLVIDSRKTTTFAMTKKLWDLVVASKVTADEFTYLNMVRACGRAKDQDREAALGTLLFALTQLRHLNKASLAAYEIAFRALRNLLPVKAGERAALTVFQVCCADGFFGADSREILTRIISKDAWHRAYTSQLVNGTTEPREWSRNIGTKKFVSSEGNSKSRKTQFEVNSS